MSLKAENPKRGRWIINALPLIVMCIAFGAILSWTITHAVMKPKPPATAVEASDQPQFARSSIDEPRAIPHPRPYLIYRKLGERPNFNALMFAGDVDDLGVGDYYVETRDPPGPLPQVWRHVLRKLADGNGVEVESVHFAPLPEGTQATCTGSLCAWPMVPMCCHEGWCTQPPCCEEVGHCKKEKAAKPAARPPAACCAGSPSCIKSQNDYLRAMIECKHKDKADKPPTSGVRNNARICGPGCLEWDPPWVIDKGHYTNKVETNEVKVQTYEDHCVVCVPNDECKPCEQQPSFAPMCNGDACSWTIN